MGRCRWPSQVGNETNAGSSDGDQSNPPSDDVPAGSIQQQQSAEERYLGEATDDEGQGVEERPSEHSPMLDNVDDTDASPFEGAGRIDDTGVKHLKLIARYKFSLEHY